MYFFYCSTAVSLTNFQATLPRIFPIQRSTKALVPCDKLQFADDSFVRLMDRWGLVIKYLLAPRIFVFLSCATCSSCFSETLSLSWGLHQFAPTKSLVSCLFRWFPLALIARTQLFFQRSQILPLLRFLSQWLTADSRPLVNPILFWRFQAEPRTMLLCCWFATLVFEKPELSVTQARHSSNADLAQLRAAFLVWL